MLAMTSTRHSEKNKEGCEGEPAPRDPIVLCLGSDVRGLRRVIGVGFLGLAAPMLRRMSAWRREKWRKGTLLVKKEQGKEAQGDYDYFQDISPVRQHCASCRDRPECGRQHYHEVISREEHFREMRRVDRHQ